MATRLKNMRLTSVDLVRNGANQEADICLFKSTDPEENPVQPTAEEKNIFKRFIDWLRQNPADEPQDDEDTVEKDYTTFDALNAARENNEKLWQYTSALTESIRSIQVDNDLDMDEKYKMMLQSLDQFDHAMEELLGVLCRTSLNTDGTIKAAKSAPEEEEVVEKLNPYHGSDGRFTSASGGGAVSGSMAGGSGGQSKGKFDTDKQTKEVQNIKGYVGNDKVYDEIDRKLSPLFGDGKDTRLYDYDLEYGGIDKVSFFGAGEVSNGKTTALVSFWAKDVTTGERVGMEDQIEVRVVNKSARFDEIEEIDSVQKFNPYHGSDGRFASGGGGGGAAGGKAKATSAAGVKYKEYKDFPREVKYKGKKYYSLGERGHADLISGGKAQRYVSNDDSTVYMDEAGEMFL